MGNFHYFMPTDCYFGRGCVAEHKAAMAKLGKKAMVVTGKTSAKRNGAQQDITDALDSLDLNNKDIMGDVYEYLLSQIAQSAYKFANDLRLLQSMKELEEPFGKNQVGSSAMAYKRNPMRCERVCSLARFVMANAANAPMTASTQWLERTLDDSANRRLSLAYSAPPIRPNRCGFFRAASGGRRPF